MAEAVEVVFYGLSGLTGRSVSVFCAGLYCGVYAVTAEGTITVPFGSDPDGLFTIAYIQSVDAEDVDWGPLACDIDIFIDPTTVTYTVPCVIGFAYTSQGQTLRPSAENEIKSSLGSGLAKPRQINQIGVLADSTIGVSFGTSFSELTTAVFTDAAGTALTQAEMFSGVHQMPIIPDRGKYDSAVCWEISLPYPCNIVSLTGFIQTEERD